MSTEVEKLAEEKGMEGAIDKCLAHPFFATGVQTTTNLRRTRLMLTDNYRYWGPTPEVIKVTWPKPPTIERLAEITKPTLIIIGSRDADNIIKIADTLNAKIAGSKKVVIPNTSHHLNMEKPGEYNKIVTKFLNDGKAST
jgi:pimeloyl-ACP methyl ester carboxylesterase